jgi:chromosome segregation ATPase
LSEDLAKKRLGEASLLKKIAELEEANANLKIEKESVVASYCRLASKYKDVEAKVKAIEKEKVKVEKSCTTQVAEVEKKLVKEVEDYMDYRLKFWRSLRALHEIFVSSLGEIGARCLPSPPPQRVLRMRNFSAGLRTK